jgi:hypothetical protein
MDVRRGVERGRSVRLAAGSLVAALLVLVATAGAGAAAETAVLFDSGCASETLEANDDGSTADVALPFGINFFGKQYSSVFVNNNGNLTFDDALGVFTPFPIVTNGTPIIAPFFADVDTRGSGSGLVHWGTTTFDGRPAFCATWANVEAGVGYYPARADKLNTFQAMLVDRSNITAGDFDIVFNYNRIEWETGDASGGANGLGGTSARVGYSNGIQDDPAGSYEFPGSGINGALLDTNTVTGLVYGSHNSSQPGRYVFTVRNGVVEVPAGNDVWPRAVSLDTSGGTASTTGLIAKPGQARWYQFDAPPGSQFAVDVTDLPANYDLAVFKDIGAAYEQLASTDDLLHLTASGESVAPSQFSPSQFSPSQFSPSQFSPSQFSPSQFSPSQFSPSQFSPSQFSPSQFSPSQFSPSQFSPDAPPSAFSPDAFAGAQIAALIGLSAHDGTAAENATLNTWNDTHFYVRVTGRNGEYDAQTPFGLNVTLEPSVCTGIVQTGAAPSPAAAGGIRTVILADLARMEGNATEKATLLAKLQALASRPEVAGAIVDLGGNARVQALDAQADAHPACPYAKNLVASSIKDIVDSYRVDNPVAYVVVVGNDHAIPFFRYPDQAGLGPESQYSPPVADPTASLASLRLDYVLSQDAYGAKTSLALSSMNLPIPDLPVGRLVETAGQISGLVDAYLSTAAGVAPTPHSSLVTGYDFLSDASGAVQQDLAAGLGSGGTADTLITNQGVAPTDVGTPPGHSWTADQLRAKLLGARHDLIFLAGHFSANNALAADFATTLNATELNTSTVDLTNSIVFSAGCHSGYNIVNGDGIPGVTVTEDWAEAFARKKATLVAGTGYQYGDSDFLEYSERLYSNFAHALRLGTGPVSVGNALVRAKQDYLAGTPSLRGMHAKAVLQATLFGLPMLSVSLPSGRIPVPTDASIVTPAPVGANPGQVLGLSSASLTLTPALTDKSKSLTNVAGGSVTASWLSGPDGVATNPGEPALPLSSPNVSVPGQVLRGVGFRGGSYADTAGVTPLTGAPATESPGIHTVFLPQVFLPRKLWTVNYFDALAEGAATGTTRLMLTPAQYRGDAGGAQTSTLRRFSSVALRLYYSANIQTFGANTPGQSAAPTIANVSTEFDATTHVLTFEAQVVGDPSAGVQGVWVVYSGLHPGQWEPLDLQQSATDSSRWTGTVDLGTVAPSSLRYVMQAVNGVGLVTLDDNVGAYYVPGGEPGAATGTAQPQPTELTFASPSSGRYGDTVSLSAQLNANGAGVPDARVTFSIGGLTRSATTNASGVAQASVPLLLLPRTYRVGAGFDGDAGHGSSSAAGTIAVTKAPSTLTLAPAVAVLPRNSDAGNDVVATLRSGDAPLRDQSVLFVVKAADGSVAATVSRATDYLGQAHLAPVNLAPAAGYVVTAHFGGPVVVGAVTVPLDSAFYEASSAAGTTVQVVDFAYGGLLWPLLNPPKVNTWVRGVPVPLRFTLGAPRGLGIFASGYPQSQPVDCTTFAPTGIAEASAAALPLVYVAAVGQYLYTWKTLKTYTGCRQIVLRFVDGTTNRAYFKFKP